MLYDFTVPAFKNGLDALSTQLAKALEWGTENDVGELQLIAARLAPDMFPLAAQVRIACSQALQAATHLGVAGAPDLGEDAVDFAGLQAQIATTRAWLETLDREAFGSDGERAVAFDLPVGLAFDMTAATYVRDWAIPQFYFHLVAAYAILRHMGTPLGKIDYVGYMMPYLRPETAPAA